MGKCYMNNTLIETVVIVVQSPQKLSRATVMSHLAKCLQLCSANGHVNLTTVCLLASDTELTTTQLKSSMDELNVNV